MWKFKKSLFKTIGWIVYIATAIAVLAGCFCTHIVAFEVFSIINIVFAIIISYVFLKRHVNEK